MRRVAMRQATEGYEAEAVMTLSDEHHVLKADLAGAIEVLGVTVQREQRMTESGSLARTVTVTLPQAVPVRARFMRESFLRRARKLFVSEVEVGSAWFDDLIYVMTTTREATAAFLSHKRVQQALMLLVDEARHVEVGEFALKLVDHDAHDEGRDALAELLALAKHLLELP
jgi:hypothetical protein